MSGSSSAERGASPERRRPSRPPERGGTRREIQRVLPAEPHGPTLAWWGTITALIAFGMLLAAVMFAYGFLSAQAQGWPPEGTPRPGLLLPGLSTALLLLSVVPATVHQRAAVVGRPGLLQSTAVVAALLGVAHLGLQASTYTDLPMQPTEGAYGSVFILLLVLHHVGVLSGVVAFLVVSLQIWDRPGERQMGSARSLGLWWQGLVAYWLVVAALLYVSPLLFGGGG